MRISVGYVLIGFGFIFFLFLQQIQFGVVRDFHEDELKTARSIDGTLSTMIIRLQNDNEEIRKKMESLSKQMSESQSNQGEFDKLLAVEKERNEKLEREIKSLREIFEKIQEKDKSVENLKELKRENEELQKQLEIQSKSTKISSELSELEKYRLYNPNIIRPSENEIRLQKEIFAKFKQTQEAMMNGTLPPRFISVTPSPSGLGNDVEAATSAAIFAIVTGRGIMIESQVSEAFAPNEIDWSYKISIPDSTRFISMVGGVDEVPQSEFFDILACQDIEKTFEGSSVLSINSNQYYAALIINNPHYRQFFMDAFGRDVFGPVFRFMFRPVESAWNAIERFKKISFGNHYVIGLHLREEYIHTRPQPISVEIFFKCALQATPSHLRNITKYFIATDMPAYVSIGESILGKENILAAPVSSRTFDLLTLGECDDMIATTGSTFSDIAYARVSKLPLKANEVLMCFRDVTTQPCFFYYKKALLQNNTASCYPKEEYSSYLYQNPIFLNHRNCYHNFQWGMDHI